jgi:3-oxoacyl-(acyl-carrier-protein) synthase
VPPDEGGIVVTGLGLVLPHGVGRSAAQAIFEGRSAVALLGTLPEMPDATGAALHGFTPPAAAESADRAVQFAAAAADEAWAGAATAAAPPPPDRIAVVISLSKGAMMSMDRWAGVAGGQRTSVIPSERSELRNLAVIDGEIAIPRRDPSASLGVTAGSAEPMVISASTADAAARMVAARLGATGPIGTPVTACSSGGHALAWGATMIRRGIVDMALVGAAEASLCGAILGSYRRMGVLAAGGTDPATSVRPFSASRRGFAIGEGAAVLVLESAASAARRRARPMARLLGWAAGGQATSLTATEADGAALAHVARLALDRAGISADALDMVYAHGTATVANDLAEARALRSVLGSAASRVSVTSTKGTHGHLLGAATAVELALTVLAIERGEVPPTANLTDPDPEIGLDCTPLVARQRKIRYTLKIASGFGGHVLAVVLGNVK